MLKKKVIAAAALMFSVGNATADIPPFVLHESPVSDAAKPVVLIPAANVDPTKISQTHTHLLIEAEDGNANIIEVFCGLKRAKGKKIERAPNLDRMTIESPNGDQFSSTFLWDGVPIIETIDPSTANHYFFQTINDNPPITKNCAITGDTGEISECTTAEPFVTKEVGDQLLKSLQMNCDTIFKDKKSKLQPKYVDPDGSYTRAIMEGHRANLNILLNKLSR